MLKNLYRKALGLVVIVLFFCVSGISSVDIAKDSFYNFDSGAMQINGDLSNIMVTGFWNPTGQMITPFSNNSYLNPGGWKGSNWENLGYNIYSYFPTPGIYNGTFVVDYQNVWSDFWNITAQLHPIAIISFGAGNGPWEIEYNARNLGSWISDDEPPYQPTPCPPDDSVAEGYVRHSTLPVQQIADAVNNETSIEAWIDWNGNPGAYLCEYIAYLGMWYQALYNATDSLHPCRAAGFIHVHSSITPKDAMEATNVTLQETIKYLNRINNPPNIPTIDGPSSGKSGTEYTYTFVATDPEGHDVSYYIEWGDDSTSSWTIYRESGREFNSSHTWDEEGTYEIRVKAKDSFDAESDWKTLEVSMPKNKLVFHSGSFYAELGLRTNSEPLVELDGRFRDFRGRHIVFGTAKHPDSDRTVRFQGFTMRHSFLIQSGVRNYIVNIAGRFTSFNEEEQTYCGYWRGFVWGRGRTTGWITFKFT